MPLKNESPMRDAARILLEYCDNASIDSELYFDPSQIGFHAMLDLLNHPLQSPERRETAKAITTDPEAYFLSKSPTEAALDPTWKAEFEKTVEAFPLLNYTHFTPSLELLKAIQPVAKTFRRVLEHEVSEEIKNPEPQPSYHMQRLVRLYGQRDDMSKILDKYRTAIGQSYFSEPIRSGLNPSRKLKSFLEATACGLERPYLPKDEALSLAGYSRLLERMERYTGILSQTEGSVEYLPSPAALIQLAESINLYDKTHKIPLVHMLEDFEIQQQKRSLRKNFRGQSESFIGLMELYGEAHLTDKFKWLDIDAQGKPFLRELTQFERDGLTSQKIKRQGKSWLKHKKEVASQLMNGLGYVFTRDSSPTMMRVETDHIVPEDEQQPDTALVAVIGEGKDKIELPISSNCNILISQKVKKKLDLDTKHLSLQMRYGTDGDPRTQELAHQNYDYASLFANIDPAKPISISIGSTGIDGESNFMAESIRGLADKNALLHGNNAIALLNKNSSQLKDFKKAFNDYFHDHPVITHIALDGHHGKTGWQYGNSRINFTDKFFADFCDGLTGVKVTQTVHLSGCSIAPEPYKRLQGMVYVTTPEKQYGHSMGYDKIGSGAEYLHILHHDHHPATQESMGPALASVIRSTELNVINADQRQKHYGVEGEPLPPPLPPIILTSDMRKVQADQDALHRLVVPCDTTEIYDGSRLISLDLPVSPLVTPDPKNLGPRHETMQKYHDRLEIPGFDLLKVVQDLPGNPNALNDHVESLGSRDDGWVNRLGKESVAARSNTVQRIQAGHEKDGPRSRA